MREKLLRELWLLAGIVALCGLIGLLTGWLLLSLLIGLSLYTARHLFLLGSLPDIIGKQYQPGIGYRGGLWADVIQSLGKLEQEHRLRERTLSQSLEHFRETMSVLQDAVVILNTDGRIEWSNAAAKTLLGIPERSASGQYLSALVRDPLLDEYMNGGNFLRPLTLSAPGDRSRTLLLHVYTIDGDSPGHVITAQDISRHYHLNETQRDFIANVSHELRTPLTVITGLLEQIEPEVADSETGRHITGIMHKQALRMRDLIADLLMLTRIEADNAQPMDEHVAVPDLLEAIIEETRTLCKESGHIVQADIQTGHGLLGNAGELRTAFNNLVVNAIQHTPNRANITLSWQVDETAARFSVSDTGEGIPARHIPRLTERFYRVDSSRSRNTGGSGLGLAIVREVLEKHDASLEIHSEVGHGSTFTCRFPAARTITLPARGK